MNQIKLLVPVFFLLLAFNVSAQDQLFYQDTIPKVAVKLFPNPTVEQVAVEISVDGPTSILITDRFGRVRLLHEGEARADEAIPLDLKGFEPGNYQVSVKMNGRRMYSRLLAVERL